MIEINGKQYNEVTPIPTPGLDATTKLKRKKKFGEDLVFEFLLDNDLLAAGMGQPMPADTAIALDEQLAPIKNLLLNGSIIQAKEKILGIVPDGVIITQERINKYVNMINNFLGIQ